MTTSTQRQYSNEQDYVCLNSKNSKGTRVEIVHLEEDATFYPRHYMGAEVHLLAGELEIHRRGLVPQIFKCRKIRQHTNIVFRELDNEGYARCTTDCHFLLVFNLENDHQKVSGHKKTNTSKNGNVSYLPSAKSRKVSKVGHKNTGMKRRAPSKIMSAATNGNAINTVKGESETASKITGIKKQIMGFIQKNLSRENTRGPYADDERNTYCWLPVSKNTPKKNGLYYVSDGDNTFVSYFVKNKQRFHLNKDIEVKFWSTRRVCLPG